MPLTAWSSSTSTYRSSDVPPGDCVHSSGVKRSSERRCSMASTNAGNTGLVSSGTTRPTRPTDFVVNDAGRS